MNSTQNLIILGFRCVLLRRIYFTALNIPISEGGTNSSRTHNLAKSLSYRGLKLLLTLVGKHGNKKNRSRLSIAVILTTLICSH
jgi:hypothetical protein